MTRGIPIRALAAALVMALGLPAGAFAQSFTQTQSSGFPQGGAALAPPSGTLSPQTPFAPPAQSTAPAPPMQLAPNIPAGQAALAVSARFGRDMPVINGGLIWRVYSGRPEQNGAFRLIKEDKNPTPVFALPPGNYIVNVTAGLATVVKPIQVRGGDTTREVFDIAAGGLRIEGRVGDVRIPAGQISFDVYKGSQFEAGDRRPIVQAVMTGDVVLVPDGTYYIVSNYGDANSVVRSDIRVQASKLTDVTVTHRAAVVMLKLVGERGGEAIANTAWSVLTPGGDVIKESIGAFPRVVLAEGEYRALARNDGRVYERQFKVITGVDGEVEVLAR